MEKKKMSKSKNIYIYILKKKIHVGGGSAVRWSSSAPPPLLLTEILILPTPSASSATDFFVVRIARRTIDHRPSPDPSLGLVEDIACGATREETSLGRGEGLRMIEKKKKEKME